MRMEGSPNMHDFKRFSVLLFILCALPIATRAQATGVGQNSPPPLGKLVDVGGYKVHLYCTGAGSPTVVIVGAGFSFDWGLVQPEVANITQVCSYDHSGIAWSDDGPADSCALRVREIHEALKNAGIKGPMCSLATHWEPWLRASMPRNTPTTWQALSSSITRLR
jgi:hypothetical protein